MPKRALDTFQYPFKIKILSILENNFLNFIKSTHQKPTGNIILNSKVLNNFLRQ